MLYRRRFKFFLFKVLRLHGTPHKVSLGFALGSAINFIPTFGFAIPLAAFLAGITRLHMIASVIGDVVFKPLFPVFLYLNYRVGYSILQHKTIEVAPLTPKLMHFSSFKMLGTGFFLGMCINVLIFTAIIYLVTFTLLKYFRLPLLRTLRSFKMLN